MLLFFIHLSISNFNWVSKKCLFVYFAFFNWVFSKVLKLSMILQFCFRQIHSRRKLLSVWISRMFILVEN